MEMDWSSLHKIVSDNTRKSILELLAERGALNYSEIMTVLSITNTGRLNYHLKGLGDLIGKDDQGKYRLTDKGHLAADMLKTFPERVHDNGSLNWRKLVSVVLISVGILMVAPIVLLGVFFISVQAAFGGAFILLLSAILAIGVALIIAGLLTYRNRILI